MLTLLLPAVLAASPPPGTDTLRGLLWARHDRDLPDHTVLVRHGGVAPLGWLAEHDDHLIVRTRALLALGTFPDPEDRAVCRRGVFDAPHPKLRAAAITCLHPGDLVTPDLLAAVERATQADDPRVAHAAVELLDEHRESNENPPAAR
jgi:hypothetical protein